MSWTGVITNAGRALIDQWAEGGHTLTIDRAAVGSGLTAAADMFTATNLANQQAAASIISKEAVTGGTKFKVLISPAATTAYIATELGLWAHIDSESSVLMSIHQDDAGGVAIPTQAQSPDFAFAMYIIHAITNTDDLVVNIDPNAYVPLSMFTENINALMSADETMREAIIALVNGKLDKTGASTNNTVAFTTGDEEDSSVTRATGWSAVPVLLSGLTHASLLNRISTMMKNVRFLWKLIGDTDISGLSTQHTVTGALSKLNTDINRPLDNVSTGTVFATIMSYRNAGRTAGRFVAQLLQDNPTPENIYLITFHISTGSNWVQVDAGLLNGYKRYLTGFYAHQASELPAWRRLADQTDVDAINSDLAGSSTSVQFGIDSILYLYKRGKIVFAAAIGGTVTADANTTLVNIPEGYRPVISTNFVDAYSGSYRMVVSANGNLTCSTSLNNFSLRFSACWACA